MNIFKKGIDFVKNLIHTEDKHPVLITEGDEIIASNLDPDIDVNLYKKLRDMNVPHEVITKEFHSPSTWEFLGQEIKGYGKKTAEVAKAIGKEYKKAYEEESLPGETIKDYLQSYKEVGNAILDIPRYAVRGLTSAWLGAVSPQKPEVEIKPKELGLPEIIYGDEPIKSAPKIFREQKQKLVESGFKPKSKLANTLAGLSTAALVFIDTDFGAGSKARNKLTKEIIEQIEKETGKALKADEVKRIAQEVKILGELKTPKQKEAAFNAITENYLKKAVRETKDDEFKWFKEAMEIQHYEDKYGDPIIYLPDKNIYADLRELTPEQRIKFIEKANEIPFSVEGKKAKSTEGLPGALLKQRNIVEGSGAKQTTLKDIIKQHPELEKVYNGIAKPTDERAFNLQLKKFGLTEPETKQLEERINLIKPELEKIKGKKLTNNEVIKEAQKAEVLSHIITRDESKKINAMIIKTKERIGEIEKLLKTAKDPKTRKALQKEQIDLIKSLSSVASDWGRKGHAFKQTAAPKTVKDEVLRELSKMTDDLNELAERAAKVDWNNAEEVTELYRKYMKPKLSEIIDEFRYNSMLSNPRTQLRNLGFNTLVTAATRPTLKTIEAGIDLIHSALTGKEREIFLKEVPVYVIHTLGAVPEGFKKAWNVLREKQFVGKPDLAGRMKTYKKLKLLRLPTNLMEAGDIFFRELITSGEQAALMARGMEAKKAFKKAQEVAEYSLLRAGLDPKNKTGQGHILSAIDHATSAIDYLRKVSIKGAKPLEWFIPFLRTPMNFAKQWIEFSPLGLFTLWGNTKKKEQLAKMLLGSMITAYGAKLTLEGKTTWGVPRDPEAKKLFFASGKKPYSVRIDIGDKQYWVPMMYLGPLAYALALPAAFKYNYQDNPKTLTDSDLVKTAKAIGGITELLSEQTFLENLGKFIDVLEGKEEASIERALAFTGGQFIPLDGLIRYITTLVDPVYRKADGIVEEFERTIPFLSKELEPHLLPTGEEAKRNIFSYIAPYDITRAKKDFEQMLQYRNEELQMNAKLNEIDKKTKRRAVELMEKFKHPKGPKDLEEIGKELSGNKNLLNAFTTLVKKQANYMQALVEPYKYLSPKARAEIIIGRFLQAKSKEDMEELQEFINALNDNGLMDESTVRYLQSLQEKIKEGEKIKQKR